MIKVTLKHASNPDINGGYWEEPVDSAKAQQVEVKTMAEASKACTDYIARNRLGGGNWTGGDILENGKVIANVAYNGKVWAGNRKDWKPETPNLYTPTYVAVRS